MFESQKMRCSISMSILTTLALHAILLILPLRTQSLGPLVPSGEAGSGNLIEKTCRKTPHYDVCISTLESHPESSNTDVSGLAHIISDSLLEIASGTLDYIHGLLKKSPEEDLQRALANCAELYIQVVKFSLPQAIEALINGHFGFANFGISDSAKEAEACEKGFPGSTKSPLADRNSLVASLSDVAKAIINLLNP